MPAMCQALCKTLGMRRLIRPSLCLQFFLSSEKDCLANDSACEAGAGEDSGTDKVKRHSREQGMLNQIWEVTGSLTRQEGQEHPG